MSVVRGAMVYNRTIEYRYGKYLLEQKEPVLKEIFKKRGGTGFGNPCIAFRKRERGAYKRAGKSQTVPFRRIITDQGGRI